MRGLYFCIRTPCAGHAQTRAGAAHVSLFILFRKGRRAAKRPAPSAAARPKRRAGRKPARKADGGPGAAERKSGGARERRRNAAKATRRERAEPRRETTRPRPRRKPRRETTRPRKKAGRQEKLRGLLPRSRGRGRKPPAEPGSIGQKRTGSDAVRGGSVHFSRSFGERSHKPPFFAPFGHPVVISER